MGWTFHDIQTLPDPGDIVWCKFPRREDRGAPGPVARPVLVRESYVLAEDASGLTYGSVMVSYGTGETDARPGVPCFVIRSWARARQIGLHKPTLFALDPGNTKNLLWCEEYFVPQGYVAASGIRIGRLSEEEFAEAQACLAQRGSAAG